MARGVAKNGLWRGRELAAAWLVRQSSVPCACGCGEFVVPKIEHRRRGIPRFVHGHHTRVSHWNSKNVAAWVAEQQGRHECACGCGEVIVVRKKHHATGIPRFVQGHQPPPAVGSGPAHPRYVKDRSKLKPRAAAAFSEETRRLIFDACGGRCAWCGTADAVQFDHVVTVAEGGNGDSSNGQLLCANCHWWKSGIALDYRDRRQPQHLEPMESAA
jgi:hypothetical protein